MSDSVVDKVREAVAAASSELGMSTETVETPAPVTPAVEAVVETKPEETETEGKETVVEKVPEETKEEAPAKDGKTKETPAESEEEYRATAEELAAIDKNPELKKVYRSLQRRFTQRTTELSGLRKEAEMAMSAIESVRSDPEGAILALATAANLKVTRADGTPLGSKPGAGAATTATAEEDDVVSAVHAELTGKLGKEVADAMTPALVTAVQRLTGREVAPMKARLEADEKAAADRSLQAGIQSFGASIISDGGEWDDEMPAEMAKLVKDGVIRPNQGAKLEDFLGTLHTLATAHRQRKGSSVRQINRIKESVRTVEPARPANSPAPVPKTIHVGMDIKEATRLAVEQARADQAVRSRR